MAVEAKRGCGYRKVGGLYLCVSGVGVPCCKMPIPLEVCPCCGSGIKQARGWTWVDAAKMFASGGCSADAIQKTLCPLVNPAGLGRVGLLWIGEKFYPTPRDFMVEGLKLGISRRVKKLPRDYEAGKTWVMLAHPKAIAKSRLVEQDGDGSWVVLDRAGEPTENETPFTNETDARSRAATLDLEKPLRGPGVFYVFKPERFELIVKQSDFDAMLAERATFEADDDPDEKVRESRKGATLKKFESDRKRGIIWVAVPDDDKDHQGTAYDKEEKEDEPETA